MQRLIAEIAEAQKYQTRRNQHRQQCKRKQPASVRAGKNDRQTEQRARAHGEEPRGDVDPHEHIQEQRERHEQPEPPPALHAQDCAPENRDRETEEGGDMIHVADRADVLPAVGDVSVPVGQPLREQGKHVHRLQLQHTDERERRAGAAEQMHHPRARPRELRCAQKRQRVERDREKALPAGRTEPCLAAVRRDERRDQREEQIQHGADLRWPEVGAPQPDVPAAEQQREDDRAITAAEHKEDRLLHGGDVQIPARPEAEQKDREKEREKNRGHARIEVRFRFHDTTLRMSHMHDLGAEGREGELRDLEKLLSERDADDGDAPQQTDQRVAERHRQSEEDQPDDVRERRDRAAAVAHLFSERPERQRREFEALQAVGNADDGDAPDDPREDPGKAAEQPAENEPQKVSEKTHDELLVNW